MSMIADLTNFFYTASVDILCDLGVRTYVGSREIPKDHMRAVGIF